MSKARFLVLLTATVLITAIGAHSASAAITIAPAGASTATSIGTLRFSTTSVTLNCGVTFNINWLPGPIDGAGLLKVGTVTLMTFAANPCGGAQILVLGMPNSAPNPVGPGWDISYNGLWALPSTYLFIMLGARILFNFGGGVRCLYQGQIGFTINFATGVMTLLPNNLAGTALAPTPPALCGNGQVAGTLQLNPMQTLIVR